MSLDDYNEKESNIVYIGDAIQMEVEIYNLLNFYVEDNEPPKELQSIYDTAKIEHQMEMIMVGSSLLYTNIPTVYEDFTREMIKELHLSNTKYTFKDLQHMLLPYVHKITDMKKEDILNSSGIEKIEYENDVIQPAISKYANKPHFYDIYVLILFRSIYEILLYKSNNNTKPNKPDTERNTDKYKIESTSSGLTRKESPSRNTEKEDVEGGYKDKPDNNNKPDISDEVKDGYEPKITSFNDVKSQYNSREKTVEVFLKNGPAIFSAYEQYRNFSRDIIFELFNSDLQTREDVIEYFTAYLSNESTNKNIPVLNNYLNNYPDVYINVFTTRLKEI